MGMDTRTGEIRQLAPGEGLRPGEVWINAADAADLSGVEPAKRMQRLAENRQRHLRAESRREARLQHAMELAEKDAQPRRESLEARIRRVAAANATIRRNRRAKGKRS